MLFMENRMEQALELTQSTDKNPLEAAAMARSAIGSPDSDIVTIDLPPNGSVDLPGGFLYEGEVYRTAEVRELTGADEEALTKAEVSKNLARFYNTLLGRGVTSLGPLEKPDSKALDSLLVGDREALLLAIRRVSLGDDLKLHIACPACGNELDVTYDLSCDIPVHVMEDPLERQFPIRLRNGRVVQAALPTGGEQGLILSASRSGAELNTLLLSRCVFENGLPIGISGAQALGMRDRRKILEVLTDKQPGPKYSEMDLECPACAKKFPMAVDVADLFR